MIIRGNPHIGCRFNKTAVERYLKIARLLEKLINMKKNR